MNPFWRTVESWTTQQDYVWFLALLAWAGFIAAELRRTAPNERPRATWLTAFALSAIAGFVVQLVLLAQDIKVPYLKMDFAMGAAQAAGTAALVWGATRSARRAILWRSLVIAALLGLAIARWNWPITAGLVLCVAQAAAVLAVLRTTRGLRGGAAILLVVLPIIATHGPWAYAIVHGRRNVDWSHFALAEAGCWLVVGTWLAVSAWRHHWTEITRRHSDLDRLRRDMRRAFGALAIWIICGLGLSVWYGRQTRQAYETYLLRRTELIAQLLDADKLAIALAPQLHITKIDREYYPTGQGVDVATVPYTANPVYRSLTPEFERLRGLNPEMRQLVLRTIVDGDMLNLSMERRRDAGITHLLDHRATKSDYDHLATGDSFIAGPYRLGNSGTYVDAYVPIHNPESERVIGWLVAAVPGTAWAASFTMARLQTMGLVGIGIGFWTLSIAYRLRREARQEAERKAAESAAADRLKSTFLAKVSHELRTPIQSVLGYGELLAEASLPKPESEWVAALRSHGTIMLRLVNDLIDLGALQSGAFRLELGPVDLRALVEECVLAVRPAADRKQLLLQTRIASDVPPWVKGDGVRLRQILLNLLNNAVKFTPAGEVSLSIGRAESEIDFVVADTGPGIPIAQRDRLFQPFSRLDTTSTSGSGLGLALVRGIVKAMSGDIWLDEAAPRGATFVVRLPLSPSPAPEANASRLPVGALLAGTTVLVAEDNTLVRELLVTFLEQHQATVHVAVDGEMAETMAREIRPNVLLLDIGLPKRDGVAVAEALRKDDLSSLRIIGLSAHAGPQEEARARMAGMNEFLTKPVSLTKLAQVLQSDSPLAGIRPIAADSDLQATLIAQFEAETPGVLRQIETAVAAEDWPKVRDRAHYLKNSADVMGAAQLQNACRDLMLIEAQASTAAVRRLFAAVLAAVPRTAGVKISEGATTSADE